jgi:protein SCO1/2
LNTERAMGARLKWLVGRPVFWVIAVGCLFGFPLVRALNRPVPKMPPVLSTVPPWTLTREDGTPFGSKQLEGKVYIVARRDADGTPVMKTMVDLSVHMRKLAEAFELVTIAANPEVDTQPALKAWAEANHVNPRRWVLVTSAEPEVRKLRESLGVTPQPAGFGAVEPVVLVDTRGRVRGVYDAFGDEKTRKDMLEQLMYDASLAVHEY